MFARTAYHLKNEWNIRLLPLWVCFIWVCAVPFLSIYRVGPLSSFYLEAGSLLGATILVLASAYKGLLNIRLPYVSVGLLLMAAYWAIQPRAMGLLYPGMSDLAAWTFVILALSAWACRGWISAYGQDRVVTVFAWSLFFGAAAQAVVAFMQFKGWSDISLFHGILAYGGGTVNGQLGQRNHLGHYLMWGVLAASYLWATRKMPDWLGLLCVFLLTAVLGLVNSRTILGYIIAIVLILPFWYWRAGRESARLIKIFFFAAVLAAVFQFGMGTLLDLLGNSRYETAVERAGHSDFEGSARQIEWRNAWTAFTRSPILGHGWNSFGSLSFLLNAEKQYFANNILGVLFTHCHNLILQILAEMGLTGALLSAGTMLAGVWRLIARPSNPANLFLLTAASVTMCHSMLEYPLWYIYFLTPFALMLSLSSARYEDVSDGIKQARRRNLAGGIAALAIIGGTLHLGWNYTDLTAYSRQPKTDDPSQVNAKISGLRRISETSPMLAYYADLSLTRRADPADEKVQPWAQKAAFDALTYRPYSNAYQIGLYLYRQGKTKEGAQWMQDMYYYYPYMMPFYTGKIRSRKEFEALLPQILEDCRNFLKSPKHKTAKPCAAEIPAS